MQLLYAAEDGNGMEPPGRAGTRQLSVSPFKVKEPTCEVLCACNAIITLITEVNLLVWYKLGNDFKRLEAAFYQYEKEPFSERISWAEKILTDERRNSINQ